MLPTQKKKSAYSSFNALAGAVLLLGVFLLGCTDSPTSSNNEDANKKIILLSPVGGEVFKVGQKVDVKWKLQGDGYTEVIAVDVQISPDNGATWAYPKGLTGSLSPGDGQYSWTVPDTLNKAGEKFNLVGNTQCLIRVQQYSTADSNLVYRMKKPFTVAAP